MNVDQRKQIERGIHYGGVAIGQEQLQRFKNELFPNAVHIAGYGNALFGLCMEVEASPHVTWTTTHPGVVWFCRLFLQRMVSTW